VLHISNALVESVALTGVSFFKLSLQPFAEHNTANPDNTLQMLTSREVHLLLCQACLLVTTLIVQYFLRLGMQNNSEQYWSLKILFE
jgi:hypothetical protein